MTAMRLPVPAPRRAAAFTLMEVMIALGILMMVMATVYSTWAAILRGKRAGDAAALNAQRTRVAVRSLEDALRGAQYFQANANHYLFLADTTEDFAFLSLVSRLPESFPGGGLFGGQVLRRVEFSVEPGTNTPAQLVMRQKPMLAATNDLEEPYPIVLAQDVTDFALEFWDAQGGEWLAEWPYTNQIPTQVRFMIGVGSRQDRANTPKSFEVATVAIPSVAVPADLQGRRAAGAGGAGGNNNNPRNPNDPADPNNPGGRGGRGNRPGESYGPGQDFGPGGGGNRGPGGGRGGPGSGVRPPRQPGVTPN
jgi:type II secretory pathway component PulJ